MHARYPRRIAFVALLAACGLAQAAVQVDYRNPQQFTEFTTWGDNYDAQSERWLASLQQYIEKKASGYIAPDQTLVVTISDLQRAGRAELLRTPTNPLVRVVRDDDAPRMELHFTLKRADGTTVAEGDRRLRDMDFLYKQQRGHDGDTLRFEKSMVDDWLQHEFGR